MRRFGQFWDSLSDRDQLRSNCDPHSVLKFIGSGGGRTWSRDGGAVPPEVLYFIILYTYALSRQNTSAWISTPTWVGLP